MKKLLPQLGEGEDPVDVANAVMHALFSETPKRRYLVASGRAAQSTIDNAINRVLQLNQDQPQTLSRDQLVKILDEQLKHLD